MKLRVQAQYLQPGDSVGSGEVVQHVTIASIAWPTNKCRVQMWNGRNILWGKYTMINVEREESK